MKNFKDLHFKVHPVGHGLQATMNFDNDYGVSVLEINGSYGFESYLWEVAILYKDELTFNTDITDYVLGHQTDHDVTDVMKKVQALI